MNLQVIYEAVGKRPSAKLPSSLVTAAYFYVRLIPRDFGSLASGHFPSASGISVFRQLLLVSQLVRIGLQWRQKRRRPR